MKTTVDLPDELLLRLEIAATKRCSSVEGLMIAGLHRILAEDDQTLEMARALAQLKAGYHLGGKPMSRDESLAR